ncbi:hypothetical protein M407DRAFT_34361, partial [Tulasnella calospora MUT 4182]
ASGTTSYAITTSSITQPAGYTVPPTLAGDLASGFATNSPIPIPTIPTTYYPGLGQISPLAKNIASATTTSKTTTTTSKATTTTAASKTSTTTTKASTTTSASGATQTQYGQCGGTGWTGATVCASPYVCTYSNDFYSQCL